MFSFLREATNPDPYPNDGHSTIEKSCPIYFDHKLPDTWSSYPYVYNGLALNENARPGRKPEHIPVITNCESMTMFENMEPLCPYPPYKANYKERLAAYMDPERSPSGSPK